MLDVWIKVLKGQSREIRTFSEELHILDYYERSKVYDVPQGGQRQIYRHESVTNHVDNG